MRLANTVRAWWWLVHKDLLRELRAPKAWPAMVLVALAVVMVVELPIDLPTAQRAELLAGTFWLAAFFAGTLCLERSLAAEMENGCLHGLLRYPVSPGTVYLAKVAANLLPLCALDGLLLLAFTLLSGVSLLTHAGLFLATVLLANLGFAAVGTLISAMTSRLAQRSGMLVLLLLPLVVPVILAAAGGTRALLADDVSQWRSWIQLLSCFAAVFLTVGTLTFEFVMED